MNLSREASLKKVQQLMLMRFIAKASTLKTGYITAMIRLFQQALKQQCGLLRNDLSSMKYSSINWNERTNINKRHSFKKHLQEEEEEYEQHETFLRDPDSIKEDQNAIPLFREEDPKYLKYKSLQSSPRDRYKGRERERTPNLLTWEEKEKIRSLYKEHPDEWTLDRLCGNFPATKATIKKILKEKWVPKDVKLHDEAVNKHWKQLLAGEIEVSPNLKHHLLSFAPKQLKHEDSNESRDNNTHMEKVQEEEKSEDQNSLTKKENFQQLTISLNEQNKSNKFEIKNLEAWSTTGNITKYQTKRVKVEQKKPLYPERIRIPEEKWQEGATYKVGDVYYDSDGEFLYRVPGMT